MCYARRVSGAYLALRYPPLLSGRYAFASWSSRSIHHNAPCTFHSIHIPSNRIESVSIINTSISISTLLNIVIVCLLKHEPEPGLAFA